MSVKITGFASENKEHTAHGVCRSGWYNAAIPTKNYLAIHTCFKFYTTELSTKYRQSRGEFPYRFILVMFKCEFEVRFLAQTNAHYPRDGY